MEEVAVLLVLLWIGLGILTAAVAKRYNRDPLVWGLFGALAVIIAIPLLLYVGPREGQPVGLRNVDPAPPRRPMVWRGDYPSEERPEPTVAEHLAASSSVVRVLAVLQHADFSTLSALPDLEPAGLVNELSDLVAAELVAENAGKFVLTPYARSLIDD